MNATASATGEVLAPGEGGVRLVAAPRPFSTERVDLKVPAGLTIAEMLALAQPDPMLLRQAHVFVGDHYVPRQHWHRVRPKPGAIVTARVAPAGGGGKNPFRMILTLAVLAASFILPGAILGAAAGNVLFAGVTAGQLLGAGIGIVGSLLVNAIAPPPVPKLGNLSGPAESPTLFITGARNEARPFGVLPRVLGRHRMVPPLGALTYTETRGDEQYLHMLLVWGYGPLEISDVRIGETPIAEFSGVSIEHRQGYDDDAPLSLFPADVLEEVLSAELTHAGSWVMRTSQPQADRLSVDITLPYGLIFFGDDPQRQPASVAVEMQYRAVGAGSWTSVTTWDLTDMRSTAIRLNHSWATPSRGQYQVRLRRTTPDATSDRVMDRVYWTALRSITNEDPIGFPHPVAKTAIEILATDQLSGVVDTLNGVVASILPDWDADTESWVERATSRPASLYRAVLQGTANARPLPDERVDLEGLARWHERNVALGQECNAVIDYRATVLDVLHDIAAAGRARPTRRDGGKWGVVVDEPQSVPVQHFTPRNSWGFQGRLAFPDLPHGWRVRFLNRDADWRQDERIVYDDGYSAANATKFEGLELVGITDPDQVWRDGRFHIAQARLRPHTYSLNADVEHLVCERGSLVRVTHDVMLIGLASGRIKAVERETDGDVTALTLDETIEMQEGTLYGISIRTVDDAAVTAAVVTDPGAQTRLVLETPLPAASVPEVETTGADGLEGCLVGFGERGRETADYLVRDIRRGANLSAQLVLVDAAPGVHLADLGTIPPFASGITVPPGLTAPAIQEMRSDETVLIRDIDGALTSRILVQLLRPSAVPAHVRGVEAAFRPGGSVGAWTYVPPAAPNALEISIFDVEDGETYDVRVRYTTTGQPGPWSPTVAHRVIGKSTPPPDPYGLAVEGDRLRWLHDSPRDHRGFLVRSVPGTAADWGRGQPAHAGVLTAAELDLSNSPRGARVWMAKAIDVAGNESTGFAWLARDLGDPVVANVVKTADLDADGFPGTVAGGTVTTAGGLEADDTTDYLPDGAAPYLADGDESYLPSTFTSVSYETEVISPDSSEAPSRLLARVTATGVWSLSYLRNPYWYAGAITVTRTSDYLMRASAPTGVADSSKLLMSLHLAPQTPPIWTRLLQTNGAGLVGYVMANGRLRLQLGGRVELFPGFFQERIFTVEIPAGLDQGEWRHILFAADTNHAAGAKIAVAHVDDVEVTPIVVYDGDSAFNMRFQQFWRILGPANAGGNPWAYGGRASEIWIGAGQWLDTTIEGNRRKFTTADGTPVDLGADGSTPTGTAPTVYFSRRDGEAPEAFAVNRGTGGEFTLVGSLADAEGIVPELPWRPWPGYVDVEAGEELKFRWSAAGGEVQGALTDFDLVFDVPDESERHGGLALDAGGTRVPITKTYREIVVVNATLHGGGSAVRVEILDKDETLGPLLKAYDSSGSGAAATVDVLVQGVKG